MGTAVVAASQGHYDEDTLDVALRCETPYVGLVASRLRGASVKAILGERGVPGLGGLRNPAGLDLGARTAPEVALSILAEIVQTTVAGGASRAVPTPAAGQPDSHATAVDPVCGMDVEIATARHTADVEGATYYFCCAGCRSRFVKQPDAFLTRT